MSYQNPYLHSIHIQQDEGEASTARSRRNSWSSDVGVAHDYVSSHHESQDAAFPEDSFSSRVELLNVVTPDGGKGAQEFFHDDENDDQMFEPYHDRETNRIIMRMRMGSLMDDDGYEETEIVKTSVVEDQSPAWALFEKSAFDRFSPFFQKNKHQEHQAADVDQTPFDQVSYTDPYNAWDSLPTFLQSPYSLISSSKKQNNNKHSEIVSNSKRKMKEMRINRHGFPEESTITTTSSSSTTSINHHENRSAANRNIADQGLAVTEEKKHAEMLVYENIGGSDETEKPLSNPLPPATDQSPTRSEQGDNDRFQIPSKTAPLSVETSRAAGARFEQQAVAKSEMDAGYLEANLGTASAMTESSPSRHQAQHIESESFPNNDSDESSSMPQQHAIDEKSGSVQTRLEMAFSERRLKYIRVLESPASPFRKMKKSPPRSPFTPRHDKSSDETAHLMGNGQTTSAEVSSSCQSKQSAPSTDPSPADPEPILDSSDEISSNHHPSQPENKTSDSIETVLEMYKSMIQNKSITIISEIRKAMEEESVLSEREITAFLYGLDLVLPQNRKPLASLLKSKSRDVSQTGKKVIVQSLGSEVGTTASTTSFASPRMKARASFRSTGFDEGMSSLMASIQKETAATSRRLSARNHDDAKTSISVMSTLSCRELSIQRLRRRMTTTKKKEQDEVEKLLQDLQEAQNRQKRLEQQLNQAGISIAEDIPYEEAKAQVAKIANEMQAIGSSQATHADPKVQAKLRQEYFVLEQKMEKYMRALELTDEFLQEQERLETAFDEDNLEANQRALEQLWKHMPVNIRQHSVDEWLETRSPSGKFLPKPFLLKFSRTNILTLVRMNPDFIQKAHPSNLEQRRVTGLTLTERRALQAFLYPIATGKWRNGKDALTKRKWNWYCILRQTLKDHLLGYQHHTSQYEVLSKEGTCPCGALKCPVKADQKMNYYENDYGYPSNSAFPEYETVGQTACSPQKKKKTPPRQSPTRSSMLAELSSRSQKKKMPQRKSSLMEEIAAKAAKRKSAMQ